MQAQDSFKKGDMGYVIINYGYALAESVVLPCMIDKIVTEDRIKDYSSKTVHKARRNVMNPKVLKAIVPEGKNVDEYVEERFPNAEHFPKMAWISYIDPTAGNKKEVWRNVDSIKRSPREFLNQVN